MNYRIVGATCVVMALLFLMGSVLWPWSKSSDMAGLATCAVVQFWAFLKGSRRE